MSLSVPQDSLWIDKENKRRARVRCTWVLFDCLMVDFKYLDEPPEHYHLKEYDFLENFERIIHEEN